MSRVEPGSRCGRVATGLVKHFPRCCDGPPPLRGIAFNEQTSGALDVRQQFRYRVENQDIHEPVLGNRAGNDLRHQIQGPSQRPDALGHQPNEERQIWLTLDTLNVDIHQVRKRHIGTDGERRTQGTGRFLVQGSARRADTNHVVVTAHDRNIALTRVRRQSPDPSSNLSRLASTVVSG